MLGTGSNRRTANFVKGIPLYSISPALAAGDEPVLGIIDVPADSSRYSAADARLRSDRPGLACEYPGVAAVRALSVATLGDVGIEVLSAVGRWDHFASFMVPSKPGGGGCVCMAYRNSSLAMPGRIAHMRGLCDSEPGPGVLAFVDGQAVGWCSIAPKATYRALVNSRTIPHVDDADAWSAVCFVVRSGFRRRGLMHDLLDGAVEHARASGAIVIEGYPVEPAGDRVDQTSAYVGTVRLFEAHGFERVLQTTGRSGGKPRWLVRRELG